MQVRFGAGLAEVHRERLAEWVRANGIEPSDVPIDTEFQVEGDKLTVGVFMRGSDGRVVVADNSVVRTKRTVPLVQPWPGLSDVSPAHS